MVKYDVSGLSEANLGQTEEKQLLGFLKIVESTFSPINLNFFQISNIGWRVPKNYLTSPVPMNLDLRLVGKIDKQVRSTTAACLNCKSRPMKPPAIGPPANWSKVLKGDNNRSGRQESWMQWNEVLLVTKHGLFNHSSYQKPRVKIGKDMCYCGCYYYYFIITKRCIWQDSQSKKLLDTHIHISSNHLPLLKEPTQDLEEGQWELSRRVFPGPLVIHKWG